MTFKDLPIGSEFTFNNQSKPKSHYTKVGSDTFRPTSTVGEVGFDYLELDMNTPVTRL